MAYDFISLFERYGIDYTIKESVGWVNVRCPFPDCGDDAFHLGLNIQDGYANCFRCGGRDIRTTLGLLLRVPRSQAEEILEKYSVRSFLLDALNEKKTNATKLDFDFDEIGKMERRYLKKRGFDPDFIVSKYGIRSGGFVGEWAARLMIPIIYEKRIVSYQGRDMTGVSKMRYKTLRNDLSIIDAKHVLYNLDNCKKRSVTLMEGATDVWRFGDDCVASLGTGYTPHQIALIAFRFDRVNILFDPEPLAQKRATKLGKLLYQRIDRKDKMIRVVDTQMNVDPGDMTDEQAWRLRWKLRA